MQPITNGLCELSKYRRSGVALFSSKLPAHSTRICTENTSQPRSASVGCPWCDSSYRRLLFFELQGPQHPSVDQLLLRFHPLSELELRLGTLCCCTLSNPLLSSHCTRKQCRALRSTISDAHHVFSHLAEHFGFLAPLFRLCCWATFSSFLLKRDSFVPRVAPYLL